MKDHNVVWNSPEATESRPERNHPVPSSKQGTDQYRYTNGQIEFY